MKTFFKWLVPPFLKRADDFLLSHYPTIWHSRALYVFFWGLLATPVLFVIGFFYPLDAQHLTVDPTKPIEMGYDKYYQLTAVFLSIAVLYWAYKQYQLGYPFRKAKDVLLTLGLYSLSFWLFYGVTAPAFRLGTIYKTAYHWILDDDMEALEKSGIYPYGFVLLEQDSIYNPDSPPDSAFWEPREAVFRAIWRTEDSLLQYLYQVDTIFWKEWLMSHKMSQMSDLTDRLDLSDRSYLSYLLDRSYLSYLPYMSDRSYQRTDLSYRLYQSYQLYLMELSYLSYHLGLPYNSGTLYMAYRSDLSYLKEMYQSNLSYLKETSDFLKYSQFKKIPQLKTELAVYKFNEGIDTLSHKDDQNIQQWFQRPALPYSVENSIRSVKHSQLYWENGIYFRHLFLVGRYVLLLALLLWLLPLVNSKPLSGMAVLLLLSAILIPFLPITAFEAPDKSSMIEAHLINILAYLFWAVIAIVFLLLSIIRENQSLFYRFAVSGLFVGVFCVLLGALFVVYRRSFSFYDLRNFDLPHQNAFYGIQLIGIFAAVLIARIRTFPKV
ncbi:MAG TPA: hypothetical protein VK168_20120 [Saprospiraceae bacterium]|nr:hypothetical protein [Saprospiraceae bacterium]